MHQVQQYWGVLYLVSTQHIAVPAKTQGCTPEKHIMRSDGKSCLASDMNSILPFFHVRQYSQKELLLTCFNFTDTGNLFSSVGAFSFHLSRKIYANNIIKKWPQTNKQKSDYVCLFTSCYIHYSVVSANFYLIKYE